MKRRRKTRKKPRIKISTGGWRRRSGDIFVGVILSPVNLLTEEISIIPRKQRTISERAIFSRRSALQCATGRRQRPSARRPDRSLPLSSHFRSAPEMRRHSHKAAHWATQSAQRRSASRLAHIQWKSTVRWNESVGNWHRAPGTRKHFASHQRGAIDWDRYWLSH